MKRDTTHTSASNDGAKGFSRLMGRGIAMLVSRARDARATAERRLKGVVTKVGSNRGTRNPATVGPNAPNKTTDRHKKSWQGAMILRVQAVASLEFRSRQKLGLDQNSRRSYEISAVN